MDSHNDRLKYLDIRDPINVLWVKLTFTGINRDTTLGSQNILSFRFDLVGCPNDFGTVVDIDRKLIHPLSSSQNCFQNFNIGPY